MNLPKAIKKHLKTNTCLKNKTTLKIGGRARFWYEPEDAKELAVFLKSRDRKLPIFVIGAGSNLLIKDGPVSRIFISLSKPYFSSLRCRDYFVRAGSGVKLGRLVSFLSRRAMSGFEFLAGIPGTVGGALAMNAGALAYEGEETCYHSMGEITSEVEVMDLEGGHFILKGRDLRFSYRDSNLKSCIILSAVLKLRQGENRRVSQNIASTMSRRLQNQEWRYPSAGSFFKNPQNAEPAGRLIDACRLKGERVGDALISLKHANFIVNTGQARYEDVVALMEKVRQRVYEDHKILLEPEVEIVS